MEEDQNIFIYIPLSPKFPCSDQSLNFVAIRKQFKYTSTPNWYPEIVKQLREAAKAKLLWLS